MKPIFLEDCRRVFIATMKVIYLNDKPDSHTYTLVKSRERAHLDDNSGDVVLVPTKKFNGALGIVLNELVLHKESATDYKNAFAELGWILRPKDKNHQYKRTLSEPRGFHGKSVSCYNIDRIKFDLLAELNGTLARANNNQEVQIPVRTPDGEIDTSSGTTQPTTVTYGLVQDSRYNRVSKHLDKRILEKEYWQ